MRCERCAPGRLGIAHPSSKKSFAIAPCLFRLPRKEPAFSVRNRDAHGAEGWPLQKLGPKNRSKDRPLHGEGASGRKKAWGVLFLGWRGKTEGGGEILPPRRSARGAQNALRGPTRHSSARRRESGRSAQDDNGGGRPVCRS